jgi:hypothetical protein
MLALQVGGLASLEHKDTKAQRSLNKMKYYTSLCFSVFVFKRWLETDCCLDGNTHNDP